MCPERRTADLERHLVDAIPLLDKGMKQVKARQVWYAVAAVLSLMLLVFLADVSLPWGLGVVLGAARFGLTCSVAYSFWSCVVLSNRELNGMISVRKDINNMLKASPQI